MTALKSFLFLVLVAGLGAAYVPFVLVPAEPRVDIGLFAYLALPLWLAGGAIVLRCFWDFTFRGHGTPNPLDPPRQLVITGFYRYVRNPIYVGVLAIILGHFFWFQSIWMLVYAALAFLFFHLFVTLYEEPALKARFGAAYEAYCRSVPRWIPRIGASQ